MTSTNVNVCVALMALFTCVALQIKPATGEEISVNEFSAGKVLKEGSNPLEALAPGTVVTIEGKRISRANGVLCSRVETDDGQLYPVDGLPSTIALGERLRISGEVVLPTTCMGPALLASTLGPATAK